MTFLIAKLAKTNPKEAVTPIKDPRSLQCASSSENTTSKFPLKPDFLSSYLNFLAKASP